MRIFYFLVVCFVFGSSFSCEEPILDNSRSRVRGQLVDESGSPIPGIYVEVSAQSTRLDFSYTDDAGFFEFTSLNSSYDDVALHINEPFTKGSYNEAFTSISYFNNNFLEAENTVNYGVVELPRLATFELVTKPETGTENTVNFRLTYTDVFCERNRVDFEEEVSNSRNCFENLEQFDRKTPDDFTDSFSVSTPLNSLVFLDYRINNSEEIRVEIPVTNLMTSYELSY
ncbi:carboxypeptidase-like regulatory domain-containing protein [Leeuwenhoekiella sp. H156]|uniref:carboxypeptidase-like regulatory domain-containing protein n=1 Tax=Leeuwenhoekiella sp. H156 TaxID=3450128 RepID=UPI003FA4D1C6